MSGPDEIWIDERVIRTMNTEPDGEANNRGVRQLRYISSDRVAELLLESSGGAEFFIQIESALDALFGLTNYGRLYRQKITGGVHPWEAIDVPDFK